MEVCLLCFLLEEEHKNNTAITNPHIKGGIDANEQMRALRQRAQPLERKRPRRGAAYARTPAEQVAER